MSAHTENQSVKTSEFLRTYLKTIKRFWWVMVICVVVLSTLLPLIAFWKYTPQYRATCSFTVRVVNNSVTESINNQYSIYYDKDLAEQLEKTFTYILTSDHLNDEVRQELDEDLAIGRVEATCVKGSNLFELKVWGDTPQEAYNTLIIVIKVFPKAARYVVGDLVVEMLEEPFVSTTPANSTHVQMAAIVGAVFGLTLGLIIVVLILFAVRTVRTPEELEELLNMSCLGVVPVTRELTGSITEGEFRESIRGISRKVETAMEADQAKILLVTGTMPEEGKSLLSRYIAQTLAEWDKRVYLVDCDLRSPSQYKAFRCLQSHFPLGSYLIGAASLQSVMYQTKTPGLTLVGNSQCASNPTVLLHSPTMENLIHQLSQHADYVILDAPPCASLSDVSILQNYADRILYVVRQDYAPKEAIVDAVQSLTDDGSKFIGFAMNFAEKTAEGYGKYGYGAYSYGKYGNGYYGKYGRYSKYSKYHEKLSEGPADNE